MEGVVMRDFLNRSLFEAWVLISIDAVWFTVSVIRPVQAVFDRLTIQP